MVLGSGFMILIGVLVCSDVEYCLYTTQYTFSLRCKWNCGDKMTQRFSICSKSGNTIWPIRRWSMSISEASKGSTERPSSELRRCHASTTCMIGHSYHLTLCTMRNLYHIPIGLLCLKTLFQYGRPRKEDDHLASLLHTTIETVSDDDGWLVSLLSVLSSRKNTLTLTLVPTDTLNSAI